MSVNYAGKKENPLQRIITFGFPQGSVSGPRDFSYYSDEVPEIAQKHWVSVHMYADDTQLYLPFELSATECAESAVTQMEDCIEDIRKWMAINKLKLNYYKSELMIITPSRQSHKCNIKQLTMGDCKVDASISVRNLGVIFDDTLSMKPQVDSIIRQTNYQLRAISRIRNYLNFEACSNVIHTSISSRLD